MNDAVIKIATRKSKLALKQAELAVNALKQINSAMKVEILPLSTEGDRNHADHLYDAGGKGLFIKEIEEALLDGRADIAVHSTKDLPAGATDGLAIAAFLERADPRDALLSEKYKSLAEIPAGGSIGTSSPRRKSLLLAMRPDLTVIPFRGNITTRIEKMQQGQCDATILAAAGLRRLGMEEVIQDYFTPEHMLPAIGQGAIALQCRNDDRILANMVHRINHTPTALCILAERAFLQAIGGSCHQPLAAYAELTASVDVHLRALIASEDGTNIHRAEATCAPEPEALIEAGTSLATQLAPHLI